MDRRISFLEFLLALLLKILPSIGMSDRPGNSFVVDSLSVLSKPASTWVSLSRKVSVVAAFLVPTW